MRITVVHNPSAGAGDHEKELIVSSLVRGGHEVRYHSPRKRKLRKVVERDTDLLLIVGGDGTVKKVVTRLPAGGAPIAILPVGTANNIAKALRAWHGLRELVDGLDLAVRRPLDICVAHADFGSRRFVEALGGGVFARVVRSGSRTDDSAPHLPGNSIDRALRLMATELDRAQARHWRITVDGKDASGDYLMVEVMNMRMLGPNVPLAYDADPGDGMLDVVLVGTAERDQLLQYLSRRIAGERAELVLPALRGQRVELEVSGELLHIDDERWPEPEPRDDEDDAQPEGPVRIDRRGRDPGEAVSGRIVVEVEPAAVNVLVVSTGDDAAGAMAMEVGDIVRQG